MAVLETILFGLAVVVLVYLCVQWQLHLLAILYGRWRLHDKSGVGTLDALPGVSILKPLTGVDPNLYSNLETFFHLNYPVYELLFCVEDDVDAAIMVVRSLIEKHPHVKAHLFIGAKKVGINPKINNMIRGYETAQHELVLISDSGLRMREDTLTDMVTSLKEGVGLVHQMPFVCDRDGFCGVVEKVYFGTQHAKMYLSADFFGINCVTGMSCLFRRGVLEEAGGLAALGQYLAEDYYLGQAFHDRGWKLRVSSQLALQNAGSHTLSNFQARMRRWAKLRAALVPLTAFFEPFSECMLLGLLASWAVGVLFNWSGLVFFFVHCLLWFLLDYILLSVIQNGSMPFSRFECVVGWLFRELTSLCTLLRAHSDPVITWRSKRFLIKSRAMGEEVRPASYV